MRAKAARRVIFSIRFWGVRGSCPAPGPHTAKYGGNTPCVELRAGNELLIFDAGTGIRALGDAYGPSLKAHLFISHYHYDHLQGLPFFTPLFDPKSQVTFYGPSRMGQPLQQIVSGQMKPPYFPVTAEMVFRAKLEFRTVQPSQPFQLGDVQVSSLEVNHPGGNLAYRVERDGKSVVYATDTEHGTEADARLEHFARGCDVLIYDSMYSEDEYAGRSGPSKVGWGHSTWQQAVRTANNAGAKQLVLFHHDPSRDDRGLDRILRQVRKTRKEAIAAREGQVIEV